MAGYRLSANGGIDRTKPLGFRFEGRKYEGFDGDTLASALLANGERVFGRSFKYHRPRGLVGAGVDEPNAIIQLERGPYTTPNLKATTIELYEGLRAGPVNAWPSLRYDIMAVNDLFSRFLPAGFYYKTFMWPDWHLFEPMIRKAAGLGRAPEGPDPSAYEHRYIHCDVLVIGGGAAGLSASLAAARSGARTIIVERDFRWGGRLQHVDADVDGKPGADWVAGAIDEIASTNCATLLNRTQAFGFYDHGMVYLLQSLTDHLPLADRSGPRERLWKVRAKQVIIATGAFERPMVFPNNDRPGVMLAEAGLTYAARYAAAPGRSILMATNNSSAYTAAAELAKLNVSIGCLIDARDDPPPEDLELARRSGIDVRSGRTVINVDGVGGVRSARIARIDSAGRALPGRTETIECDTVLCSSGWSPVVHLASQAGAKLRFDDGFHGFVVDKAGQNEVCVGAAAGCFSLAEALSQGWASGRNAAQQTGYRVAGDGPQTGLPDGSYRIRPLWRVQNGTLANVGKSWLDYQNDVTTLDVELALRESFKSVEHVKRYTTLGMASDQGKTSNVNGIGVMESVLGKPMAKVGTTKFRPPFEPVAVGAFAGRRTGARLSPLRLLPSDSDLRAREACLEEYGGWIRPAFIPQTGEDEAAAVYREVTAVRSGAGLFDASPLGKIEVRGTDAAKLLNRIYINNMLTLKSGRCRYGLMLDENGIVFDDGILARLDETHFLVGTTSGHARAVAAWLEEWRQCEWPDLDASIAEVTTQWAVINVCGPMARDVLQSLDCDIDLSNDGFPHMSVRSGRIEEVECRIQRVSFTGELSYEVAVPWSYGASLWARCLEASEVKPTPFGVEALMTMRIEKGYLHIGSDTDGMTQPQDLGFATVIEKKADDFVGRRSTMRADGLRTDRRQLVGLEASDGVLLPVGAHVVHDNGRGNMSQGWVTSSATSPTLNRPIALAMVEAGRSRLGEEVTVWDLGQRRQATIVRPGFYDPEGARLNA